MPGNPGAGKKRANQMRPIRQATPPCLILISPVNYQETLKLAKMQQQCTAARPAKPTDHAA
jgi:hypothetical protein